MVGREDSDLLRKGFNWECAWVAAGKGRMDEVELLRIRIPEERGGFVLICTRQCLLLEVGIGFAVQSVVYGNGGRLIQSHQFGQLGEHGRHQRIGRSGFGNGQTAHLNGRCRVDWVTPGYCEVFVFGIKHIKYLR